MIKRIKIGKVSTITMAVTCIVSALFFLLSFLGNKEFCVLKDSTEQYITCEKAAKDLQDGSDYLTEQVRLYATTGQREYLDNYFHEANDVRRRELAIEKLKKYFDNTQAFDALKAALDYSTRLMDTEYYSMRLVLEAEKLNAATWPDEIKSVELSAEDEALSASDKMKRAQYMVSDRIYQNARTDISGKVSECMDELIEQTHNKQSHAVSVFSDMYTKLEIGILLLAAMMLSVCIIMRRLVVRPLIKCNESIANGETFPVEGADELQVLAETYNKVYQENQEAQLLIRHKAEHDPLTDLLNRGSFEKLLHLYEDGEAPFALIMVDVDKFKSVNDNFGHAVGDIVLKTVADMLTTAFRSIDYVCRIGGDEFAVIMVEMTSDLSYTIEDKINSINQTLKGRAGGDFPPVSVSAGVAFSDRENPGDSIFNDADKALYKTKDNGRSGCSFY